ncbi:MAG TPA: Glu-tRNA(Gln) amidotransferase subunit GatD [Candidatus Acidoferrales bacterium]|nr:Glu-tRNA(Gln) amidotransferase subunit GatD [Candidatus Acidoferrales bacterium]
MEIEQGDKVLVEQNRRHFFGVLMPSTSDFIVIKLDNGYNVGFSPNNIKLKLLQKRTITQETATLRISRDGLPRISVISTGGTIASKIDYRTGAVTSQFNADDIIDAIPELADVANIEGKLLYNILSENMAPELWMELAQCAYNEIARGMDGVIITHGTDTMGYSAAALSFMLKAPVPVVFVGSQRSADRPSSDNVINAVSAAVVATSDIAEVTAVMHENMSDDFCLVHRGTRMKKLHTSRRDAFTSVNATPIARVQYSSRTLQLLDECAPRGGCEISIKSTMEPMCALIKFYPGAKPHIIDHFLSLGYKGLVIEGTGLGHVSSDWIPKIKTANKEIPVVMTSQCIFGRVNDRVYDAGRDLLKAGVIGADDMLSETALVKLMWVLGQTTDSGEIRTLMTTNIAQEISVDDSRTANTFEELS